MKKELLLVASVLLFIGCEKVPNFVNEKVALVTADKIEAEAVLRKPNFSNQDKQILRNYFEGIVDLSFLAQANMNQVKKGSKKLKSEQIEKFCQDVLLDPVVYMENLSKCTNDKGYFLCSDEMIAYPEVIASLKQSMGLEEKCQAWTTFE